MQFYTSCPSSSFASQQEVLTIQQLWLVVLRLPLQTFCSVAWDFISAAGLTLMLSTFSAVLYGVVIWKWGSRREVIFFIQIDKKAHIGELGDLILWLKNLLTEKMQHRFRVKCPCTVPETRHLWTPWEGSMHCSQIERPCSAMLEPTIFFFSFFFLFSHSSPLRSSIWRTCVQAFCSMTLLIICCQEPNLVGVSVMSLNAGKPICVWVMSSSCCLGQRGTFSCLSLDTLKRERALCSNSWQSHVTRQVVRILKNL